MKNKTEKENKSKKTREDEKMKTIEYNNKEYDEMKNKYGKKEIERWLKEVTEEELYYCLFACSNLSFFEIGRKIHREKVYNILDYILCETTNACLYKSSTYGVQPNNICYEQIGYITKKKYGNFEIAMFLIEQKRKELKKWVLTHFEFSEKDKKILHYFKTQHD